MTFINSSYQNKLFEKFKSSLDGSFSDLKSNLSGIDWVERSVTAARYTAELANKDAWLAMCDAFGAISTVLNALYQAEQAQQSAYHAMNESINASNQAWQAETEAMHAARRAYQSELSELKEDLNISFSEGEKQLFEAGLKQAQNNIITIQAMNAGFIGTTNVKKEETKTVVSPEEGINLQNDLLKASNAEENEMNSKTSKSNEDIDKSKSKKEESRTKKVVNTQIQQVQENIKIDTTKQKDFANIEALKAKRISTNAKTIISNAEQVKEDADNRNLSALNISFNANIQSGNSEARLNNYHFDIKNIENITDYLNNLIAIMQKDNKEENKSSISSETNNKMELINTVKSTVDSLKEINKEQTPENNDKIEACMAKTQDTIQTITSEILQHKEIPVILNENLSDYKDFLGNQMNYDNIKIDQRGNDRRSRNDRRESSEAIFNFNQREDLSGRRSSSRREDDLTKALFINDKKLIELLT